MQANNKEKLYWHTKPVSQILDDFNVNPESGLSSDEVISRLKEFGPNELIEQKTRSIFKILWAQFTETMVLILIIAAIVSLFLQHWLEAFSILAIVILFAILGFIQEYRAEKAMAALKKLAKPLVRAIRDGNLIEISSAELVPGDIVLIENGNIIPADCRIIEGHNLRVQESALTGESLAVNKRSDKLEDGNIPLGDRKNMVYLGTVVTHGRGTGIVTDTGMSTELGSIATLLQQVKSEQTPLQKRLDNVGKILAIAGGIIAFLIALFGFLRGEDIGEMFLVAISVAVAVVPEGLPAVVTVTLAIGARRMLARNALIRKLPAVETLGSVTDICSDKTGTLTQNLMTVTYIGTPQNTIHLDGTESNLNNLKYNSPDPSLSPILIAASLCNDSSISNGNGENENKVIGDPTETALVIAAEKFSISKQDLELSFPRIGEIPFDSDRKRMTTVHNINGKSDSNLLGFAGLDPKAESPAVSFTKGAFDVLLKISSKVLYNNEVVDLDDNIRNTLIKTNKELAEKGIRVLGVGFKSFDKTPEDSKAEKDIVLLGLIGMIDPPREEVKHAVIKCKTAGIRPIMITGDHPLTANYIANNLGISQDNHVVTGSELELLSDNELRKVVDKVSVYARVSPEHKLRIVQALQQQGHIAAMTGDGVNDAPALKQADIGVAMGITGTDVSKEASDMVLRDDNFATIVAAVEEGRVIYDNIRKFVKFSIAGNLGKVLVMILVPVITIMMAGLGLDPITIPLVPLQLLWLNLLTDGLLGVGLGVEPAESLTMKRAPLSPKSNIFSEGVGGQIMRTGSIIGIISISIGIIAWADQNPKWQTMMFSGIAFAQMWQALATRSFRDSVFKTGIFTNKVMFYMIVLTFFMQMAALYIPFLQVFLSTQPLTLNELLICIGVGGLVLLETEIEKAISKYSRIKF
jgi:Ca2+-transporting ATPase